MKNLTHRHGYTIDQTILIVAIIAILITLIIVTIGWQLINRSSGTKLGSQFRQVEDANGQFYSGQRMWPHQAISSATGDNNMLALANALPSGVTWAASVSTADLRNLLPGFAVASSQVRHNYGTGGAIMQMPGTVANWGVSGSNQYMVIQFGNMPVNEAQEADRAIDGVQNAASGRLVYQPTASSCLPATVGAAAPTPSAVGSSNVVNVCYAANTVQ
ncbi:MAG: hypothetical protein EBR79_00645 [Proteobacteria bacterium]|nr:hypothetical protein [Pseudomonadota bacterium]NBX85804.1 hypothetical protein [Pseudomonadota bacterium]